MKWLFIGYACKVPPLVCDVFSQTIAATPKSGTPACCIIMLIPGGR